MSYSFGQGRIVGATSFEGRMEVSQLKQVGRDLSRHREGPGPGGILKKCANMVQMNLKG